MAIDDTLATLVADPRSFLEQNALIIYGSNKSMSGVKQYELIKSTDTGWTSAAAAGQNVPLYILCPVGYPYGKADGDRSQPLDTHYVSMREYDVNTGSYENTNITNYTLPNAGEPAMMVTSKINGCTFGVGSKAGARLVSHLRPETKALGKVESRGVLDQATRAGFEGGHLDASIMSSTVSNGTVLGKREDGEWTVYAQRYQKVGTAGMITDVQVY